MKTLLPPSHLASVALLIVSCVLSKVSLYKIGPDEDCDSTTRYEKTHQHFVSLMYHGNPEEIDMTDIKFFITGLPLHNINDYDLEAKLQKLQGNYTFLSVSSEQLQKVREQLIEPEFGLCWTASGSISSFAKDVGPVGKLKDSPVITSLFCFNNVLEALVIDNVGNATQRSDRKRFQDKCEEGNNKLVQESIYTENSLFTTNFTNIAECYAKLPCFHCEHEVIEIRKGNKVTWNIFDFLQDPRCDNKQSAIPAATVMQCFKNGGRFIKSIHVPARKLRCVSRECNDLPDEVPWAVKSIAFKYNDCTLESIEKERQITMITDRNGLLRMI